MDCEAHHSSVERSIKVEWEWDKKSGKGGLDIPRRVKILIPNANNKPYGTWAVYDLKQTGVNQDPNCDTDTPIQMDEKYYHSWQHGEDVRIKIMKQIMEADEDVPF
jgi:hypothetical protein